MPPALPRARGALDVLVPASDGSVTLGGWIGHPDHTLDGATAWIDDVKIGACSLVRREDLVAIWPHVPATHCSGFTIRGALPSTLAAVDGGAPHVITIVGTRGGKPVVNFRTHRRVPAPEGAGQRAVPVPDPDLLQRVTGNRDALAYAQIGLDAACDLLAAIDQHLAPAAPPLRILDWGCGPGRIAAQLMQLRPDAAITGCDLDAEAIAWCNTHLRAGAFHVTAPFPPLPFADSSFDAVVAVSVMTHLDWPVQKKWLGEIRRLLRPGGIFAASVHGPFAAAFFPGERERLAARGGFMAEARDKSLRGIAPRGYYRSTFQTPEFTRARWAEELAVVDYLEAGLAGFQDLVVARRKS